MYIQPSLVGGTVQVNARCTIQIRKFLCMLAFCIYIYVCVLYDNHFLLGPTRQVQDIHIIDHRINYRSCRLRRVNKFACRNS